MSGLEPLMIAAVVGGTAVSAYGHEMAGQEASRAAAFEQQQLQIQSQTQKTAADEAEARRREELTSNIETLQAIRAGRGVGASPGGEALMTTAIDRQERGIGIDRFNREQQADLSSRAAVMAGRKAQTSLLAGDLSAAGDVFSGVTKAYSLYNYPSAKRA